MSEDTCPVRWPGPQAVVTLPEHIDVSNASQIAEQLLSLVNRGAAELIADMTATVSCDYAGADAIVRAYRRAAANGTHLRLVVTAPVVRRVLAINGLDRLIAIYPSLDAAAAAERREGQGEPELPDTHPARPKTAGSSGAADPADRAGELLDWVVTSIFEAGMLLQAAAELPRDAAGPRITDALDRLNDIVREVRNHVFGQRTQPTGPGLARRTPPDAQERSVPATDRTAVLKERVAQTAHALQVAAADTAALLQQQADLAGQPSRMDYPTEVKRWRAFADQAGQMAKHWEQPP